MIDRIKRHPSSSITALFAILAAITPFVDTFRDAAEPFNIDPRVWVGVTAVLGASVVLSQMWQSVQPLLVGVSWGVPSIVGFVGGAALAVTPLIGSLRDAVDPLGVPGGFWVGAGALLVLVTNFGRVYQAGRGAWNAPVPPVEPVPTTGGAGEPAGS